MQTHSRFNTAWDVARERQRGTWMKEEASHRGFGWKRVRDWEKEEDRERGEVFMRRGGKKADYLGSFCETEALAPSTCLDIVLTTMPVRQKQSWWNLWVVLLWISQQHSLCNGTVVLAALQKINRTQHNKDTCVYPVWQPCNKCLLCEVDMFQLLVILYGHRLHVTGVSLLCMQAACLCVWEFDNCRVFLRKFTFFFPTLQNIDLNNYYTANIWCNPPVTAELSLTDPEAPCHHDQSSYCVDTVVSGWCSCSASLSVITPPHILHFVHLCYKILQETLN